MIDFNDTAPTRTPAVHYDLDAIVAGLRDRTDTWVPQHFPNGRRNGDEIEFSYQQQARDGAALTPDAAGMFGTSTVPRFLAKRVFSSEAIGSVRAKPSRPARRPSFIPFRPMRPAIGSDWPGGSRIRTIR